MLTKDLLRVSRAGGGYHLQFAGREHRPLAAKVLGTFLDSVGEPRETLDSELSELEGEYEFKLVRGLAAIAEREATFGIRAEVAPERARRVAFEAGERLLVADMTDRTRALTQAADSLGITPTGLDRAMYADRKQRQILTSFEECYDPEGLLSQYNLSLAQTALFDATEIRVRSSDPRRLVSTTKRLGLLYEVRKTDSGRELLVTGPDALFRATRRYGTRFARLLRAIVDTDEWRLRASIDDHGTERTLELSEDDPLRVPDGEPVVEVSYDSAVERDFATRFEALDLDWELVREPEPLETGPSVMIPDFAFEYRYENFRVFFEIMGFWTPEYVEKKLGQLERVEEVELLVAVDESLAVSEDVKARDHRVLTYSDSVRIRDVREALRRYERDLVEATAASLPNTLSPDEDTLSISTLAARHAVSERALDAVELPDHERVGRTLVRPAVLEALSKRLHAGQSLADAEAALENAGITDASALFSRLGYRVEWDGLSSGTLRRTDE